MTPSQWNEYQRQADVIEQNEKRKAEKQKTVMNKELTYEERVRWFVNNYYETGMEYASMLESMRNKDLDNFEWYGEKIQIPKFYKLPQQKTFGSKDINDNEIKSQILSEKYQEYRDWLNEIPEISDEEIEKAAANLANPNADKTDNWIEGAKWYKEQLKKQII